MISRAWVRVCTNFIKYYSAEHLSLHRISCLRKTSFSCRSVVRRGKICELHFSFVSHSLFPVMCVAHEFLMNV
ncbi:hypothetical protein VTN00DRAFT_2222 [Thermoascus crustaceus]|uniref:uncharacterized protein n=1 Tax=Thermoascus crustaceus TaxID=5088 RepID=UPI003742510C